MMVVHKLSAKVAPVETVKKISACFNNNNSILNLTKVFDEVIVVCDTYDNIDSLRNTTRQKRWKWNNHVQYQVLDETCIRNIPLNRVLSIYQTKTNLTEYLAQKTEYNKHSSKLVMTAAAGYIRSIRDLGYFPYNNNE